VTPEREIGVPIVLPCVDDPFASQPLMASPILVSAHDQLVDQEVDRFVWRQSRVCLNGSNKFAKGPWTPPVPDVDRPVGSLEEVLVPQARWQIPRN